MTRTAFYHKWRTLISSYTVLDEFRRDLDAIDAPPPKPQDIFEQAGLTTTEREIARLLLQAWTSEEIAEKTGYAIIAVKHHVVAVYHKLDVANRTELFHKVLAFV